MPGPRVLVAYATTHGQTARIARTIADRLRRHDVDVALADLGAPPLPVSPREVDGVVLASSVTFGRHQRSAERFARAHREALASRPTAFVSVSGAAAGRGVHDRARARGYVDEFLLKTRWTPARVELLGGMMAYTRYGPVLRWVIRRIAARAGAPTDTTRDHEFTDWAAVDRLADAFAESLQGAVEAHAAVSA